MPKFTVTTATVREAQRRLRGLGHDTGGDSSGELGAHTRVALQAFQRERGLLITGELDSETWSRLEEAGWTLGSRLLFVSRPFLRGDDVAQLQEALALLGFDPGRIDGICGPQTARALEEFQRNCGLETNGVLTRATLNELSRLSSRRPGRRPVTETRDSAGLRGDQRRRLVVLHGSSRLATDLTRALSATVTVLATGALSAHDCAARANEEGAGLVLDVVDDASHAGLELNFFESYRSHSTVGRELAHAIASDVTRRGTLDAHTTGMSVPILRETTMVALVLTVGPMNPAQRAAVVSAVVGAVKDVFDSAR